MAAAQESRNATLIVTSGGPATTAYQNVIHAISPNGGTNHAKTAHRSTLLFIPRGGHRTRGRRDGLADVRPLNADRKLGDVPCGLYEMLADRRRQMSAGIDIFRDEQPPLLDVNAVW